MKAADWKFTKFIPDGDDLEAQAKTLPAVMEHLKKLNLRGGESVHAYVCGFSRGCAWMQAKLQTQPSEMENKLHALLRFVEESECGCGGDEAEPCKICACNQVLHIIELIIDTLFSDLQGEKDQIAEAMLGALLSSLQNCETPLLENK